MVVKVKEFFKKTRQVKNTFYEDGEMQEYYQIKRNQIISILFLIQYNCIFSRLVVYKKAYDISRKGSHSSQKNLS